MTHPYDEATWRAALAAAAKAHDRMTCDAPQRRVLVVASVLALPLPAPAAAGETHPDDANVRDHAESQRAALSETATVAATCGACHGTGSVVAGPQAGLRCPRGCTGRAHGRGGETT